MRDPRARGHVDAVLLGKIHVASYLPLRTNFVQENTQTGAAHRDRERMRAYSTLRAVLLVRCPQFLQVEDN